MLTEHVYNKRTLIFKLTVYANKNIYKHIYLNIYFNT